MPEAFGHLFRSVGDVVFLPTSRFFLGYLLVAGVVGVFILSRQTGSPLQALRALFRRDVFLHRSARNDYVLALANAALLGAIGLTGLSLSFLTAPEVAGAFHLLFGAGPQWHVGYAAMGTGTILFFIAYDAGNFVQHWLQHRIPVLWELHKVHHSAEVLTPVTAARVHPVSAIVGGAVLSSVFSVAFGIQLFLFSATPPEFGLFGLNVLLALHYSIGAYHLQHSHAWIRFPGRIGSFLVSPAMHQIHHSADPKHFDKNFAFALTIWDRLAGTYYDPTDADGRSLVLGLSKDEQSEMSSVGQLYLTPMRRAARVIRGAAVLAPDPHRNGL